MHCYVAFHVGLILNKMKHAIDKVEKIKKYLALERKILLEPVHVRSDTFSVALLEHIVGAHIPGICLLIYGYIRTTHVDRHLQLCYHGDNHICDCKIAP